MKIKLDKRLIPIVFLIIIFIISIWGIIDRWSSLLDIISFIFYGMVVSYILTPISRWLELYVSRSRAVIILFVGIIITTISLMFLLIPLLLSQAVAILDKLPDFAQKVQEIIYNFQVEMDRMGLPYSVQITLNQYIEELDSWIALYIKGKMDGAMDGVGKIAAVFTVPVLSFYFTKDRDYFKRLIMGLIPSSIRRPILQMALEINNILDQFIRGQILIALIVGVLAAIGYLIIGLPYVAILGLFAGVFEIVPYFGAVLGAIPAVIIALLHSPSKVVATIIVMVLVQQLESNIFTPKIMGDHVGLHPVYIIVGLWVGGIFFGIIGMFFAVPIILILRVILKNIYLSIVSGTS